MTRAPLALRLIEDIYAAAADPIHWVGVAEDLSSAFGGAAVSMSVANDRPGRWLRFMVGVTGSWGEPIDGAEILDLPPSWNPLLAGSFRTADAVYGETPLAETTLYQRWIEPNGFDPAWPVVHIITGDANQPVAAVHAFRRNGQRPFSKEQLALGDVLVPHLKHSHAVYERLGGLHRGRRALERVADRLHLGVVLVDSKRRPVLTNTTAAQLLWSGDALRIRDGLVCACGDGDQERLELAHRRAVEEASQSAFSIGAGDGGNGSPLQVRVDPLGTSPTRIALGSQLRDAVAVLLIADPSTFTKSPAEVLEGLYGLTPAEAELVGLLTQGDSLEKAARRRGVTVNTARSQLKQAFAKTGTRRQGELIQFILTGVSSVRIA